MADMRKLCLFGVLLQMFQLCCVEAGDIGFHGVDSLSGGAIVAIVLGSILLLMLKICFCYWRFKGRTKVITRIITVHRTVPVIIRDSNPKHAGYDQGMIQQTSAPPYLEAMPQHVEPGQGPARAIKDEIGSSPPPPYTEVPGEAK